MATSEVQRGTLPGPDSEWPDRVEVMVQAAAPAEALASDWEVRSKREPRSRKGRYHRLHMPHPPLDTSDRDPKGAGGSVRDEVREPIPHRNTDRHRHRTVGTGHTCSSTASTR